MGKSRTWTGTAGFGLVQTGSQSVRDRTSPTLVPTLERFNLITCYVSHQVSEVIEGLTEYHSKNWQDFVTQMKKLYNHAKTKKRYTQRDLDSFISDKLHKFIHDLSNFWKYQRGFLRIGGWLRQHNKIMDDQFRKSFWMGLPKHIHNRLEARMFQVHPTLPLTSLSPLSLSSTLPSMYTIHPALTKKQMRHLKTTQMILI